MRLMNKPFEPRTLSGQAYEAVLELIWKRTLRPGNTIVESRLAEALGISRTPLREALQRLEGEGMIQKTSGRSFMVRRVELAEYLQAFKVREILEIEAAVMSIGRVPTTKIDQVRAEIQATLVGQEINQPAHWFTDDDVHGLYVNYCGNEVLTNMIRALRTTTRLFDVDKLPPRIAKDYAEHLKIVDALERRDTRLVVKAIKAHFKSIIADALSI